MKYKTVVALILAPLAATAALAAPPQAFLRQAGLTDNSEIELGALAQARGASPAARQAGRMLQADHRASQRAAAPLLARYRLRPPVGVLPEVRTEMRRLQRLSGRAFDRELATFNITAHSRAIALFQIQSRSGDRPTAAFARAQLPVLRHHLQMARDLLRASR
ncbi:MAG: putative rane protein [Sphingomonadales bacterium]|jgi:putative membrane protein|nr:putative rane protein [Sphingomonadales bacterium]